MQPNTTHRERRFAEGSFFSEETQFIVAVVDKNVYNSPPVLSSPDILIMDEDQGLCLMSPSLVKKESNFSNLWILYDRCNNC